jgi:hypothetical protein
MWVQIPLGSRSTIILTVLFGELVRLTDTGLGAGRLFWEQEIAGFDPQVSDPYHPGVAGNTSAPGAEEAWFEPRGWCQRVEASGWGAAFGTRKRRVRLTSTRR